MRYSIMLQIVAIITVILLANAALFAWLQNRPGPSPQTTEGVIKSGSNCWTPVRVGNEFCSAVA